MSVTVHEVNLKPDVYTIRLGYIRKIKPKIFDAWSYETKTLGDLLTLPSQALHVEPLETPIYRFPLKSIRFAVHILSQNKIYVTVKRKKLLRFRLHRLGRLIPSSIHIRKHPVSIDIKVNTIDGFLGIPLKRRGIPYNQLSPVVLYSFSLLLRKKRISGNVKLKYFIPNVAVSQTGKIRYLGDGHLMVLPGRGVKILVNVYVVEYNGKEKILMEVVR